MLPEFLVEEITVRGPGESAVYDTGRHPHCRLLLTLGITHALENESIGVDVLGSKDGIHWMPIPIVSFAPKSYCGTYKTVVTAGTRYLKAVWNPTRWARADNRPFFRMYVHIEPQREKVLAAASAA